MQESLPARRVSFCPFSCICTHASGSQDSNSKERRNATTYAIHVAGRCRFSGTSFSCLYKQGGLNELAAVLGGRRVICFPILGLCLRTNAWKMRRTIVPRGFRGWVLLLYTCSLLLLFSRICLKETLKDLHIFLLRKSAISFLPGRELKLRKYECSKLSPSRFGLARKRMPEGSVRFYRREWIFFCYLPQLADSKVDLATSTPHMTSWGCKPKMRRPP